MPARSGKVYFTLIGGGTSNRDVVNQIYTVDGLSRSDPLTSSLMLAGFKNLGLIGNRRLISSDVER